MKTIVITPPTTEPLTLSEAKEQLRIEDVFTVDDSYISALISAARDRCEHYCNQFFTDQTIKLVQDGRAEGEVQVQYPNFTITSIEYIDQDYATQTIDAADYFYDTDSQTLVFLSEFDSLSFSITGTVTAPSEFEGVKQAMKIIINDMYDLRTETVVGSSLADNPAVKALLYPYRVSLFI